MKTKIRDIVSICIFIILTSLTVILVQPAYGKLSSGVASYARGLKKTVEEQYFMQISYKSLSPSILSSVNFKDVTVSSVDGKKIASIERIRLDYKLFSLLRGDFTNGFKSLVVDGAQVSGSELALLIQENQKNQKNLKVSEVSEKTEKQTKNESFDVSMIFSDVPISVLIKNASVTYINREINAEASIKKMNLDYNNKTKQLAIGSDTQVQAIYNNRKYYGNLLFDGKLFEGFENSSATFSFQGLTDGNYRLSKLSFLLGYNDDVISLSTIKNTYPLDIRAGYNFKTQSVSAYLKANELAASSVISVRKKTDLYRKIANLSLTTDSYVSFDVKDNKLDYFSDTGVYLPDTLIPMGAEVKLALKGNDKKINIDNVSINGEKYKAQGNLEYIFENMNVSGFIGIPSVELPEGSVLSSDIYFDPLEKGFIAFIPQLFIGENVFTALQLTGEPGEDSIDFNFEGFDYSHMEADTPGKISIDGSYLFSDNYIQTSLSANSFYLDSIWKTVLCFVDEKSRKSMESATNTLKDFVCSADGYLSSDFTSVTYNVPYILAANTKKENQALLLAFDGNEQTVSLTQADLVYGKIAVQGTGSLDILKEDNEMFMIVDLNSGGIPYHFTGNVANNVFSMSGDYNTFVRVDFSRNENINGSASFDNLPFRVIDASLITTLYGDFSVSEQDGFLVELERFEIEEVGNSLQIKPRLSMSGNANRYGARLDSIVYSDIYSQLDGNAEVFYSFSDDIMTTAGVKLQLKNPMSEESVSVELDASNPDMADMSQESLLKNIYLDGNVTANNLNLNRFTRVKSNNNSLSATVTASGTVEEPYVSCVLDNLSLLVSSDVMRMSGSAIMEKRDIIVNEFNFDYALMEINRVSGNFSLDSFTGAIFATMDADLMNEKLHIPFKFECFDVQKEKNCFLPESFSLSLSSEDIYGSLMREPKKLEITAYCSKEAVNITTSDNFGFFGTYLRQGDIFAAWNCDGYANMKFNGFYNHKTGDLSGRLSDVAVDLKQLWSVINMEKTFHFSNGSLSGFIDVSGKLDNPLFTGTLDLMSPEYIVPMVMKEKLVCEKTQVVFGNGEIVIPETKFNVKKNGEVYGYLKMVFDKWVFDGLELQVRTDRNKFVPVNIKMTEGVAVSGDVNLSLKMILQGNEMELTSDIFAEQTELFINLTKLVANSNQSQNNKSNINVRCALDIKMGTHVRVNVDPLLRAIFVPGGTLGITYEQETDTLTMNGLLYLKSGDVSYLNRNFYVKEGSLKFSPMDEPFNPMINVRAETREKDEKGENVTVTLNAQNQYIRDFNPRFSSVPAKSEMEIQSLLGQIVMADSSSVGNFLFAAGDYAIQSLFGRKLENKLRDFFNFDIFSLRTNIIQNTLNLNFTNKNTFNNLNAGNFFDNSTVYIGKYLGSALYVDAMLNLQYDEKRIRDSTTGWGILFKPEFGVEMESPFGNIRWNVAPDINAMMNRQYVPSSSVSLSWKFAF